MSLLCKMSGHKWHKFPDGKDGCKCIRCSEINLVGQHNWQKRNGSCIAKCSWCGREDERHDWNACRCTWCGAARTGNHDFVYLEGTCNYKCSVCGMISDLKKKHKWSGCICERCGETRNEGHNFQISQNDGIERCTVCGISIDEYRAKAAIEALKKEKSNYWQCDEAKKLMWQISNPECILTIAPYAGGWAVKRLVELGADKELAAIACDSGYGFETRCEAQRSISDDSLRNEINVQRTEEEQRWYDYDIKSGM
ncbi:MAG: hypothetical protein IKZ97_01555 [Butyrivibrio sp.]|nr:hypothetical protein [Butyrivibrio sp.]